MKKILLLLSVVLVSCVNTPNESFQSSETIEINWLANSGITFNEKFSVVEIDSCEYLIGNHDRSRFITHKGNCKNCRK